MENKAHRPVPKWRSAPAPEPPVATARLAAPLAWGANLWLLLVGYPLIAEGVGTVWLGAAAATPLLGAAVLASVGWIALASACFLVAFPLGLAAAVATHAHDAAPPSIAALAVIALSMWVYGASAARALRPPAIERGGAVRIEPLEGRGRSVRVHAARQRARRVRALGVGLTVAGAFAILIAAPYAGDESELYRVFGRDPRHAAVLIAMVASAIAAGVVSVFTTALVRPASAEDRRPFSAARAALGLLSALAGAVTYYVLG